MRPMPVDPVKEIFRTRSSESQVLTTQFASVVGTTFTTPSGTPSGCEQFGDGQRGKWGLGGRFERDGASGR
jgi:hypothetical protein